MQGNKSETVLAMPISPRSVPALLPVVNMSQRHPANAQANRGGMLTLF